MRSSHRSLLGMPPAVGAIVALTGDRPRFELAGRSCKAQTRGSLPLREALDSFFGAGGWPASGADPGRSWLRRGVRDKSKRNAPMAVVDEAVRAHPALRDLKMPAVIPLSEGDHDARRFARLEDHHDLVRFWPA